MRSSQGALLPRVADATDLATPASALLLYQAGDPTLTSNEQRLYCCSLIHLATKEIAALLNIDPASVRRAKTRLYKKIAAADQAAGRPAAPPEA